MTGAELDDEVSRRVPQGSASPRFSLQRRAKAGFRLSSAAHDDPGVGAADEGASMKRRLILFHTGHLPCD